MPIVLLLMAAVSFAAYPILGNYQKTRMHTQMVQDYQKMISQFSREDLRDEWKKARAYNRSFVQAAIVAEPFSGSSKSDRGETYESLLNLGGDGVMGYLEIPKIKLKLPVMHGVDDDVLARAVGHLPQTSLPVGGKSSHAVLSAHRGLPSGKLFTDLDQMEEGDIFVLYVLDKELYYRVNKITVKEPEDTDDLKIVSGKDYVTLLTCTPYSVNSHRLLVRGERIEKPSDFYVRNNTASFFRLHFYGLAVLGILLITTIAIAIILKKQRKPD